MQGREVGGQIRLNMNANESIAFMFENNFNPGGTLPSNLR